MNTKYISMGLVLALFTACGGNSSSFSANNGKGSIDLKEYYPSQSTTKTFIHTQRDGDQIDKTHYNQGILVNGNTISTTVNTKVIEEVLFTDTNISITSIDENTTDVQLMFRHLNLGDTLFSKKTAMSEDNDLGKITTTLNQVCKLKSKEERFQKDDNIYTKDLIKIECITEGKIVYDVKQAILDAGAATDLNGTHPIYDTSYVYLKKGLGAVAIIDDDCVTNEKILMVIDDKANSNSCIKKQYDYEFYIP